MLCLELQKEQQELSIKHTKEQEKDLKRRLAIQRQEYETTIQRHVTFIDQVNLTAAIFFTVICVRLPSILAVNVGIL